MRVKIGQCRGPGRTASQCGCSSRALQKAKASPTELGCLKMRGLVAMRAAMLSVSGEIPNWASPRTILSSQGLQIKWRLESARNA
jgi:hypothetical protein